MQQTEMQRDDLDILIHALARDGLTVAGKSEFSIALY